MEKIKITILPGGVVKVETDKISGPNHLSEDRLLRGIEEELAARPSSRPSGKEYFTPTNAPWSTNEPNLPAAP